MAPQILSSYSRRGFLRQAARAGIGLTAASAVMRDLRLISTASAQGGTMPTDYKALVCIFLAGGNDSDNTIIATNTADHANYLAIRQKLGISLSNLLSITPDNTPIPGRTYGLHPSLGVAGSSGTGIKRLFEEGKAATIFNVGPLLAPTTKADYLNGTVALPPQLFSHSDQVIHWQTSIPDQPPATGWAGRLADLFLDGVPTANQGKISLNTSVAGTNTFQTGADFNQFHVSGTGAVTLSVLAGAPEWRGGWHDSLQNVADIDTTATNLQRQAYARALSDAKGIGKELNIALDTATPSNWNGDPSNPFPATPLGTQLKMVARMIAARDLLDMKRQTFFTQLGGYDTHADQVYDGAAHQGFHAGLLKEMSDAVYAFQRALEYLASSNPTAHSGLSDKVVSFTASDFGRTFRSNGLGSDHGWGGHHWVFGGSGGTTGAVKGRWTYGNLPNQYISAGGGSSDDTGHGRWIPTISVDEYSATLAKWFGVSNSNLDVVFPNLTRFAQRDIGFLR